MIAAAEIDEAPAAFVRFADDRDFYRGWAVDTGLVTHAFPGHFQNGGKTLPSSSSQGGGTLNLRPADLTTERVALGVARSSPHASLTWAHPEALPAPTRQHSASNSAWRSGR